MENIVVLKFGGTSLNSEEKLELALDHIKEEISNKNKVICVVSAMGRTTPYSTDILKSLVSNIPNKYKDRLVSIGETISSIIMLDKCIESEISVDCLEYNKIGIVTDSNYTNANILNINTNHIEKMLNNYDCIIVPGFQAMDPFMNITTLGRGGSDTSALALGSKLNVKKIEIISDVDGIYSADPRIVDDAILYSEVGYDELLKITINGTKVLHEKAAFIANMNKSPLFFKKLGKKEYGTKIVSKDVGIYNISYKESMKIKNSKSHSRLAILKDNNVCINYVCDSEINEVINKLHRNYKKSK